MTRNKKTRILALTKWGLVLALPALLAVSAVRAEVDWGVRGGVYADEEDAFVGGEALLGMGHEWYFNPNVEFVFIERSDLVTLNGDFHKDFHKTGNLTVWAGAGPAIVMVDRNVPGGDNETDLGANFLFGVGARNGNVRPYGQAKVLISDDTQAVVAFGLRF